MKIKLVTLGCKLNFAESSALMKTLVERGHSRVKAGEEADVVIVNTGVRPEYNGRGIAKRLVECVIAAARERGTKIIPVCSYAQRILGSTDEYKDVLA